MEVNNEQKNMINCIVYWGIRSSIFKGGRESKERRKKKKRKIQEKKKGFEMPEMCR